MRKWSTACKDWEERILEGRPLIPFEPLFLDQASEALEVFESLKVADVPGSPPLGDVCRPWMREFVRHVFGSYDPKVGRRLISEFMLFVSKKNAKSTLAAGIMLTALIKNWRESAEYLILAPTVEIANNSFIPAREMVRRNEELEALFHVQEHYRTITSRITGATLKIVAADNESVGGKKATGVLVDELWLFGKRANSENMLREATGGLASRPEGFVIYLTTQSDEAPAGVFSEKLNYARSVRDGRIVDNSFLPILYEFPERMVKEKDYEDPQFFYVTNPNLGASVDETFLNREFTKAKTTGEKSLRGFLAKHLNVEIGLALMSDAWPGAEFWEPQGGEHKLDDLLERCEVVVVGVDGGGLDDLLGLSIAGRDRDTRKWLTWSHAWAHTSVLKRRKSEEPTFRDFEKDGDLTIVDRVGEDVAQLADIIKRAHDTGKLTNVGLDPYAIGAILDALETKGIPQDIIIGISQGWKLCGAIKTAERKLAENVLIHDGSRLMKWCVGNAKVVPSGNAILVTKQASGRAKIDPLMALFNSVELLARNPDPPGPKHQFLIV